MRIFILTIAIAICVSACGELSYKRGASVAQLENTRQTCRAEHTDADIEKCMEVNGWTIQKLDSFEIVTEIKANTDEETVDKINASDTNTYVVSDGKTTIPDKTAAAVKPIKASKKISTSNPLDIFIVPSWWKTGVKPDSFKTDSNACVEKLGDAHKPESKKQTVTFAFIGCMAKKRWRAFKKF